jgi:hypothetical protein
MGHGRTEKLVLAIFGVFMAACVVETEPVQPKPLLRDVLRAHAAPHASALAPVSDAASISSPGPPPDAFRACDADADCVAVLRNGCCHDGRNEAINKTLADAYLSSFVCPFATPTCPTQLVLDRRVPACDAAAHLCKLVEPPP